jgi:hypothetical protein
MGQQYGYIYGVGFGAGNVGHRGDCFDFEEKEAGLLDFLGVNLSD